MDYPPLHRETERVGDPRVAVEQGAVQVEDDERQRGVRALRRQLHASAAFLPGESSGPQAPGPCVSAEDEKLSEVVAVRTNVQS